MARSQYEMILVGRQVSCGSLGVPSLKVLVALDIKRDKHGERWERQ
jgi:hypothetical protein